MGCFQVTRADRPQGGHLARQSSSWCPMEPAPLSHHLTVQILTPPPLRTFKQEVYHTSWKTYSVRTPMASCRSPHRSPPFPSYDSPIAKLGSIIPPSSPNSIPLPHRSIFLILLYVFIPKTMIPPAMPCLTGKSRQGAAWYTAKGKELPNYDHPLDNEMLNSNLPLDNDALSILAPITAPAPAKPLLEATQDLLFLSNPYSCRVEWFDAMGNYLGYATPPSSPPRPPPPPFYPPRHPFEATFTLSPIPFTSSNSQIPFTCNKCAD